MKSRCGAIACLQSITGRNRFFEHALDATQHFLELDVSVAEHGIAVDLAYLMGERTELGAHQEPGDSGASKSTDQQEEFNGHDSLCSASRVSSMKRLTFSNPIVTTRYWRL